MPHKVGPKAFRGVGAVRRDAQENFPKVGSGFGREPENAASRANSLLLGTLALIDQQAQFLKYLVGIEQLPARSLRSATLQLGLQLL
jgi:hypothetical protein